MPSEVVELEGHIIDSLILPKVLDLIVSAGADYRIVDIEVGKTTLDPSRAVLQVSHHDESRLEGLLSALQMQGANVASSADVKLVAAPRSGVLPAGFYSTTNLPTRVRVDGRWIEVEYPEMDCAIVVERKAAPRARAVPMHAVEEGDLVVIGRTGIAVDPPSRRRTASFSFMSSEVSSEKPKELAVRHIAQRMRQAHASSPPGRILAVCGPAVVHTGAGADLARLVRSGWIDVLFAGNGFAAHDIESAMMGTSLGVSLEEGTPTEGGHSNHLVAINEVRRCGSIADAVSCGVLTSGVMYECVRNQVPFVLAGSIRDDGPLPDVITDVVQAADAMRAQVRQVSVALMLASTLHAIATGNLLSAAVETFCVDINQAVATKLSDRGSHQALGLVTDVGLFLTELASILCS